MVTFLHCWWSGPVSSAILKTNSAKGCVTTKLLKQLVITWHLIVCFPSRTRSLAVLEAHAWNLDKRESYTVAIWPCLFIFLSRPFQYWFYYKLLYSLAESSSQPVKSHSQWWFCILGAQGFSAASSLEVGWHHIQIFSWITWDMLRWSVISESQDKPVAEPSGSFQTPSCRVCYCGAEWATSWSESHRIDHRTNGKDNLQEILKRLKLQLCWSTTEHRQD